MDDERLRATQPCVRQDAPSPATGALLFAVKSRRLRNYRRCRPDNKGRWTHREQGSDARCEDKAGFTELIAAGWPRLGWQRPRRRRSTSATRLARRVGQRVKVEPLC